MSITPPFVIASTFFLLFFTQCIPNIREKRWMTLVINMILLSAGMVILMMAYFGAYIQSPLQPLKGLINLKR